MRRIRVSIGIATLSTLLVSALWAGTAWAATSTSYMLGSDFPNKESGTQGLSTSFRLTDAGMTWYRQPLAGGTTQILPATSADELGSSGSAGSASSTSDAATGGSRNRRPRVDVSSSSISSSASSVRTETASSSSATSQDSTTTSTHGAASEASSESRTPMAQQPMVSGAIDLQTTSLLIVDELSHPSILPLIIWLIVAIIMIVAGLLLILVQRKRRRTKAALRERKRQTLAGYLLLIAGIALLMVGGAQSIAYAATTTPTTHVYNGRLLDSSGTAITTAHSIRFSYWKSVDFLSSDLTGAGAIDTGASNYAGWQETHTVTPNAQGYFSVALGSVSALPNFGTMPTQTLLSLYLQVDVKASASPDTSYELLDVDGTDATIDRSGVLSVPFAENSDMIDQREIGTGSGNIAILGSGGTFPVATVPGGTNASSFTLDADSTETSSIALTFGATLQKKLTYDIVNTTFRFNDDVEVQGNLTVTGLINGVNITQLQSATGALKASSGGGLNLNVSNGSYRLNGVLTNYTGGMIVMPGSATKVVFFGSGGLAYGTAFPTDESFIPVAQVTTSAGSILSILDRRALSSDDREQELSVTFAPGYEKATYVGDGGDNVGQLSLSNDAVTLKNFYLWTSTKSTLQDYDVIVKVPVPDTFVRWQNSTPISLQYRSTSASSATNKLDIQIYDTSGAAVTLTEPVSSLANTSWTTSSIGFSGSPTWTPGQEFSIRLKMSAKDAAQMHLGSLKLSFVELQ